MIVKLPTEHHKEAAEDRPSLHLSKCQFVGNLMHWLKFCVSIMSTFERLRE